MGLVHYQIQSLCAISAGNLYIFRVLRANSFVILLVLQITRFVAEVTRRLFKLTILVRLVITGISLRGKPAAPLNILRITRTNANMLLVELRETVFLAVFTNDLIIVR